MPSIHLLVQSAVVPVPLLWCLFTSSKVSASINVDDRVYHKPTRHAAFERALARSPLSLRVATEIDDFRRPCVPCLVPHKTEEEHTHTLLIVWVRRTHQTSSMGWGAVTTATLAKSRGGGVETRVTGVALARRQWSYSSPVLLARSGASIMP